MRKYIKDPKDVLDYYTWDWSSFLADGEIISEHKIILIGDDISLDESTADDTTVTARLSGGIVRKHYVRCRITTDQGRVATRSIWILIKER
jgi:hypothetical protein